MYRVFHKFWNKVAVSQLFSVDLILFLFLDYWWEIVNILIYLNKYSEIIPWTMDLLCEDITKKSFKIVQARYRKKFNFNKFQTGIRIFKKFEAHDTWSS